MAPICNKDYLAEINGPNMKLSPIFNWMGAVIGVADPEGIGNPSCLHHDSTIRVQTLMDKIDQNEPPAYELLEGLLKKFNFVGNTSFNIAGDPMVFQAEDVYINLPSKNNLTNMRYLDIIYQKLPRNFRFSDRYSMINSIELRYPFLDVKLIEDSFKFKKNCFISCC